MSDAQLEMARRFFESYNAGRTAEFLALLDEGVELHTLTGLEKGHEGAATWLAKGRGKIVPHVKTDRFFDRDERVLVLLRLQLRRSDNREVLQEADLGCVFDFTEAGLVKEWRMYADPSDALKEIGIGA